MDELTRLANEFGSDKGSAAHGQHRYAETYHAHLNQLQNSKIVFVEIGLLHPAEPIEPKKTPSLWMWRRYFPQATIVGFDVNDFSMIDIPNGCILQGDMGNRDDLARLASKGPFDLILEDASHASHHQQIALGFLFPHVKPGGMYIMEDLHWQPPTLEQPDAEQTRRVLRRYTQTGKVESRYMEAEEAAYLEANIQTVDFHDTHDTYNTDGTDALAILHKVKPAALLATPR